MEPLKPRRTPGPAQSDVVRTIREHCRLHDDLITHGELQDLGVRDRRIERWVETGVLVKRFRRVYSLGHLPLSRSILNRAALLSVRGQSLVSHQSAASALDLATFPANPVHVITNGKARAQPGIQLHYHTGLEPHEMTLAGEVPCTSAARTLIDLASAVHSDRLRAMLDRAVHLRLFDQRALDRVIAGRPKFSGSACLSAAVADLDQTAGNNRTELERIVIELINSSTLPPAANNVRIAGSEVDVHWVGTRAIIEADGRDGHTSPAQIAADLAKQRRLEGFGFRIMWVTWPQARYEPERTLARATGFLAANREAPVPGPPPLDMPW